MSWPLVGPDAPSAHSKQYGCRLPFKASSLLAKSKHGDVEMKTVTLGVATLKDVKGRAQDAFKGRKQGARISFATPELLFQLMTAKRWELIRTMTGAGPRRDAPLQRGQ